MSEGAVDLGPGWVRSLLPHRYPFLLIDRVVELQPGKRIVAIKNVTHNEPYFQGHFPGLPIMPGVLLVEAMAQAAGLLVLSEIPDRENRLFVFAGIEMARFRRPVVPGDQLRLEVDILRLRTSHCRFSGKGLVNGAVVAEALCHSAMTSR